MTDDLLKRATSALRDETGEPELRSGLTRSRLIDNAAKQNARRGKPLRWIVPFVLTLGASTALAHVTHQYFPEMWNAVMPEALERQVPEAEVVRKPHKKALATPAPVPQQAPVIEAPVEVATAPTPVTTVDEPARPRVKRTPAPTKGKLEPAAPTQPAPQVIAEKPSATAAPAESAELSLFRRAMKLHDAKDRRAIAAWDDFLRVAPKSPLALEARYNRALGLVRADRSREAKAALAPFANGEHGSYRKREAAQLLEALIDRDAGVSN